MQSVNLDIRTLIFISTSIAAIFAVGLFAFGKTQKEFKGFASLALATALFSLGPFLIGYRDVLPDFITIVLANLLNIVGIILYYEGVCRFLNRPSRYHILSAITFLVSLAFFLYFTYGSPSVNNRILTYSAIQMIVSAFCVWELAHNLRGDWRAPGLSTAFVFFIYSSYQLFRFSWTLGESPIRSFMSAGGIHALAFIANILLITGATFGFVWMVNKRLINNLTELATHDPLTNILNRRGIELLASHEFSKLKRLKADISAVMIDIDHFKQVNDRYGHSAGDAVLSEFANLIKNNLRSVDIFGRTGGEEFLIILPNTNLEQTMFFAERFRTLVAEHVFLVNSTPIHITASLGVANSFSENLNLDHLMLITDQALLQSKQNGRNQVSSQSNQSPNPA
jgi:diguanylate cyclase (GGDEF)-like protein